MDETEGKASALDITKTNSASTSKDVVKPKRRSLVERELETNMTEKVTSIVTNGDVTANISRYGRFRRVKIDPEFSDTDKAVSGYLKSPASQASASPVYKMYASNSPTRPTEAITSSEAPGTPVPLNIEVQIESIENKNLALSRFSSGKKKVSQSMIHNKGYTTLDLSREMEKTAFILKNMFSPSKSPYSSNTHLNNILERSSDKYSLEKDDQHTGYVDNSSVVKTLDFDTGKKKKKSNQKLESKTSKNNDNKNSVSKRKHKSQPVKKKSELSVSTKEECDNKETKIPVPKTEDSKTIGPKKEETANTLTKSELFEMEAKSQYQVGDLAWSRVGTYPFWPCIVTRDPFSDTFVRKKMFGRVERDVLHVNFFGDNGRRSWIVDNMLRPFTGLAELESTRDNFTREDKKKDPRLYAAFFVSDKKMEVWNKAVLEAETILRQPKRLRLDGLNEMLCNTRIYKPTPTKSRGDITTERVARTDSDVSLSESLYDTLFSEDDTKNDDLDKTGNRKKSLDVSDVVTACLDNIAVKTGISVIQKQSHMDIWLQKAKSQTPEKPQPKIDTPLKTFVDTKANSSKKSNNTPAKVTPQKPYPLRRSGSDLGSIRITRAQALNEHNYAKLSQMKDENGEDISSTDIDEDNKQTTDEDVPAETKPTPGIGTICKVETECKFSDESEIEPDCGIPVTTKEEITDSHLTVVASKVLDGTSGGAPEVDPTHMDVDVDEDVLNKDQPMEVETSELDVNVSLDVENTTEGQNSQNGILSCTKKGNEFVIEPGLLNGALEIKVAEETSMNELVNEEITHVDELIDSKSKRNDRDENANNSTATLRELTEQAFLPEPTKSLNGDLNDSHEDIKDLKKSSKVNNREGETNVPVTNSQIVKHDKKNPINVRKSARISKIFCTLDESEKAQNEIQNSPIANKSLTSNEVQNISNATTEVSPKLKSNAVNGLGISTDVLSDYNNKEKSAESTQTLNEIEENPNKVKEDSNINTTADYPANNVDEATEVNNKDDDSASKEIKTIVEVQPSRVMRNTRGKQTKNLDYSMQRDAKIQEISENSVNETFVSNASPITDSNETGNVKNNVDIATELKNKEDVRANKARIPVVVIQCLRAMMKTKDKQKKSLIDPNMDADTKIGDTENIYDTINEALESNSSPNSNITDNVPIQDSIIDGTPNIATNDVTDSKYIDVALLGEKPATEKIEYVNKSVKRVLRLRRTKKNATNVELNLQPSDDQTHDISEANNKIIETLECKLQADKFSISNIHPKYDHLPNIPDDLPKDSDSASFQPFSVDLIPNTVIAFDVKNELTVEPKTEKNMDVKNGDDTPIPIDVAKYSGMPNIVNVKTEVKLSSETFNDCLESSVNVEDIKISESVAVETNNTCKLSVSSLDLFPDEKIEVKMFTEDMKMSYKENKELAEVVQSCHISTIIDVNSVNESLKKRLQSTDHVESPIAVLPADTAPEIKAMDIDASDVALNIAQDVLEKEIPTTLKAKEISVDVATNSEILVDPDADLKSDTLSIASSVDDNIPLADIVRSSSKEAVESIEKSEENEKQKRKPRAATETEKKVNKSKEVSKAMEEPEFIKYLELRQDALIDENPHVSPDDVANYLYKTWLYEQNLKSNHVKSDDIEQSNLVKGLGEEPAGQQKKPRKRAEKKEKNPVINEESAPKDKSKRNIAKRFYFEDDDIEDELQIFEIFKIKTKSTQVSAESVKNTTEKAQPHTDIVKTEQQNITEAVNDSAKVLTEKTVEVKLQDDAENVAEEEEYDEAEFFLSELLKTKPNLFKGLVREKVCEICQSPGNLVKCKGLCAGMFHVDCDNKVVKAVAAVQLTRGRKKKKPRGRKPKNLDDSGSLSDEKSHDISEDNSMSVEESLESNVVLDADKFEEGLALKMKELSEKEDKAEYDSPYSSDEELKWDNTVAGKCEIVDLKFRAKQPDMSQYANFKCKDCQTNDIPKCFVCKLAVSPKNSIAHRQRCNLTHCHKYYHIECLDHWPQTQFNSGEPPKNKKVSEHSEALTCPRHVCHTCVSDDPRGCRTRFSGDKLARCVKCPATYHSFTKCLPAGSKILSASHIICPRHYEHRPGKVPCHVNTGWCFICALGGTLICCEYCPTSFHAECLNIKPPEGNYMCEDCETGRLPLYGEMVWVKLGHYRWWPGIVLHPSEIPDNIMAVKHTHGEFVVRFFGQYDHYWVNRGRVFPFQEGDSGRISTQKSKIDEAFLKAMDHAKRACEILKDATPNSEEDTDIASSLLPPHYVKLKVNKPCGSLLGWRGGDEENSITLCDCDPHEPEPCGPHTQCLNRMLLTECGPTCRAGERCCNRAFERRLYPRLTAYRTPHRGWGLKTLEDIKQGEFVIEYVGELIDESEFRRRMQRMNEVRDENYYFLTLDKERMIDAGPKGNLARFMNHCCEPNCETQKWTVLGDVRVGLFARQDIPANQEVTFNYNLECNGIEKKACLCGARLCSGYIGAKPKQEEAQPKKGKLTEKRKYRKRKQAEESPSTSSTKPRTPKPRTTIRSTKPRELTEIEKDLLIINSAANGISSDSESSGRFSSLDKDEKAQKVMKRKRMSFSTEDVSEERSPSVKKIRLEGNEVAD